MRIAIISDTHLSPRAPAFADNLRAAFRWVAAERIELIVHLGDVTADAVSRAEEFEHARTLLASAPVPLLSLPGNHDVGEAFASPRSEGEPDLQLPALDAFRAGFGDDRWSLERGDWQLIGLNAQLFGNDDALEADQDAWLETRLRAHAGPLGLFLHKPLFRDVPGAAEVHQRYLPPHSAASLLARVAARDLRFVAAGHTHQYRSVTVDGIEHLWAPSLAYVIPDSLQERIGEKMVGMMLLELDGWTHRFEPVIPPGLDHCDLTDLPALYPDLHP